MKYGWRFILCLAFAGIIYPSFGSQRPEMMRMQSEHHKRMEFNKKRLDEMQSKLQMLGRILATKEGKLATVNNSKFDLEVELGDLDIKLKSLQPEVNEKQNKISRLIKTLVASVASKDDSMESLIVGKALRETIVKLDSELQDFERQIIDLKSKIMIITQHLRNFDEQETILADQLLELKESRKETIEAMSELENKIDELLKAKVVDDSVAGQTKTQSFTVIMPLESFRQSRMTKKGITFFFQDKVAILAPSNGRVAYLGQLGNLGEVAIIDHGQEYRSILLGKAAYTIGTGDSINKGDVIGYGKGDSVNETTTGQIYFEIRHKNMPQPVSSFIDSKYNVSLNNSKRTH